MISKCFPHPSLAVEQTNVSPTGSFRSVGIPLLARVIVCITNDVTAKLVDICRQAGHVVTVDMSVRHAILSISIDIQGSIFDG
jgi:hypothetical protein